MMRTAIPGSSMSAFLTSNHGCIYVPGARSVFTESHPEYEHGCCTYGAHFVDKEDRQSIRKQIERLEPEWELADRAKEMGGPIFKNDDGEWVTQTVDDACIFLNRPGFEHGAGCALHPGCGPSAANVRSTGSPTCAGKCRSASTSTPTTMGTPPSFCESGSAATGVKVGLNSPGGALMTRWRSMRTVRLEVLTRRDHRAGWRGAVPAGRLHHRPGGGGAIKSIGLSPPPAGPTTPLQ